MAAVQLAAGRPGHHQSTSKPYPQSESANDGLRRRCVPGRFHRCARASCGAQVETTREIITERQGRRPPWQPRRRGAVCPRCARAAPRRPVTGHLAQSVTVMARRRPVTGHVAQSVTVMAPRRPEERCNRSNRREEYADRSGNGQVTEM